MTPRERAEKLVSEFEQYEELDFLNTFTWTARRSEALCAKIATAIQSASNEQLERGREVIAAKDLQIKALEVKEKLLMAKLLMANVTVLEGEVEAFKVANLKSEAR